MRNTANRQKACVEQAVKQFLPPCQERCPIGEDIQRTNVLLSLLPKDPVQARQGLIEIGDYLFEGNPFFPVCGYICGVCEPGCNYRTKGGSIRRRLIERFLSDSYLNYLDRKEEFGIEKKDDRVAVVGGGPAGLICAYFLSRKGYRVTVFEASGKLGGALWLIPHYRMPKIILQRVIENMVRISGVDVRLDCKIGEGKLSLGKLKKDGYKAIFIAKGAPAPRVLTFNGMPVDHHDLDGVFYGQTFLSEMSRGILVRDYFTGKRVIVIGGGNPAFDAARSARRLGAVVTLIALECESEHSRDRLPADHEEIRGAWQEGIKIVYSHGVSRILGRDGRFTGIMAPRCISVFDKEGNFNPQFQTSGIKTIQGDVLIISIGQGPNKALFEEEGLLDDRGKVDLDPVTLQSNRKDWVFVGGDVRNLGLLVDALRDGREAAESIERYLKGLNVSAGRKRHVEGMQIPLRKDSSYRSGPDVSWTPPDKRMHFQLFEKGFTLEEAVSEAKRCLVCGPCITCRACEEAGIQDEIPSVQVLERRCSGCGICVAACRYGAAYVGEAAGAVISETDIFRCKGCGMCVSACPVGARRLLDSELEDRCAAVYAAL